MKKLLFFFLIITSIFPQQRLKHFDTSLSIEERVNYLVSMMTLQEKISQMVFNAPAIERLGIPKYNWWNECLHGVARNGLATVFPQAIGLAAMWNKDLMYKLAIVISDEARAKYHDAIKHDQRNIYQGLTFWSPNINIFRDPRWGRGMETYGEDPYLTGQTAVQFVKGLQGSDSKYFKTIATAKHFAVHSGPEPDRHAFNAEVSEYDFRETYLPAFRMAVQEANVQSIMCAYNRLRLKACCSNDPLLENILRKEWGFSGYVVSDCWAISDIYQFHKQTPDAASASAISVKAGTDLECGDSYPKLFDAYLNGLIKEEDLDVSLKRLFTARFKLGMFDPQVNVPYSKIPISIVASKQNHELAVKAAQSSIVLLKNDQSILPLKKNIKSIAVIGPNANDEEMLLGNYNGTPLNIVTPLAGIKNKIGKSVKINYAKGCDIAENMPTLEIISSDYLFTSADKKQKGLKAEYFDNAELNGEGKLKVDKEVNFKWLKDFELNKSIRWSGYLIAPVSGTYEIGTAGFSAYNVFLEDSLLLKFKHDHHPTTIFKSVKLEAGKPYKIKIEFFIKQRFAQMQLMWRIPENNLEEKAVRAAKLSDVVVIFMGLSPRLEGEEMKVPVEGFKGGDRLTLDLPMIQQKLIKKIADVGKPTVLVLLSGSALSTIWEDENLPAILYAWYGGEGAGTAIADVLFGDYNPAGRLPVTVYKSVDQLPPFSDYNMKGKTYRYFDGETLYPFGFGMSYTNFDYKNLRLINDKIKSGESVKLKVDVKNIGRVYGEEVVQLYVKGRGVENYEAIKSLKGFERIALKAGETKTVEFNITPQTLEVYKEGIGFINRKGEHILLVGSSSRDIDLKEIKLIIE